MEGVGTELLYRATLSPVFKGTFLNRKTGQAIHQVMSKQCANFINLTEILLIYAQFKSVRHIMIMFKMIITCGVLSSILHQVHQ